MARLWAVCLYSQHCGRMPPRQLSVANVLRVFRHTIRHAVPLDPEATLSALLKPAVLDNYVRKKKASRDYPRKKQEKPAGRPKLLTATASQKRLARKLKEYEKG